MHARRLSALLALVAAVGVPRSVAAESRILQRVVVAGQPAPGGGDVAFAAAVSGGKTVEGIFATTGRRLRAVAVVGGAAPGIASGTFANLDAPALNDRGDVAFLATVRRGRETVEAIYLSSGATL